MKSLTGLGAPPRSPFKYLPEGIVAAASLYHSLGLTIEFALRTPLATLCQTLSTAEAPGLGYFCLTLDF